uniref:Uncharacterized protein n=1 Tax=Sinocyclocheilus anshuiensis TaxID=1608454 RepID=A0A671T227_9TELE
MNRLNLNDSLINSHLLSPTAGGPLVQLVIGRTEPVAPHRRHSTAQKQVLGPCAVLPPALLQWNVGCHTNITVESLSLFYRLEPRIKVLVLGTGKKGIAVEVQDTDPSSCRRITASRQQRTLGNHAFSLQCVT